MESGEGTLTLERKAMNNDNKTKRQKEEEEEEYVKPCQGDLLALLLN